MQRRNTVLRGEQVFEAMGAGWLTALTELGSLVVRTKKGLHKTTGVVVKLGLRNDVIGGQCWVGRVSYVAT